jgi:hypothetical protein
VAGVHVFDFPFRNRRGCFWHVLVESRIEEIYHQMATRMEALINATQGPLLLIRRRQVMKRAERHKCQSKQLAEFKRGHIHLV